MLPLVRAAATLLFSFFAAGPAAAGSDAEPYTVAVWASVLFGADGKAVEFTVDDEARYPAKFADNVKSRLAKARIPPPQHDGQPTTLRTGVRMDFRVTPTADGGQVQISGLALGALPLKRYYASYPKDIGRAGGWEGEVEGVCTIGVDGRCRLVEVTALAGMPETVRRYVKASLDGWTFAPQEVGGKPVEGEFVLRIRMNTLDDMPEDFRQDKFLRVLNSR